MADLRRAGVARRELVACCARRMLPAAITIDIFREKAANKQINTSDTRERGDDTSGVG